MADQLNRPLKALASSRLIIPVILRRTPCSISSDDVNNTGPHPFIRLIIVSENQNHRRILAEDNKIQAWNEKLQRALDNLVKAGRAVNAKGRQLQAETNADRRLKLTADLEKKRRAEGKAHEALDKINQGRAALVNTGSGKVSLLNKMIES